MRLKVYLAEYDLTNKQFSDTIGYNPNYIRRIVYEDLKPSKRLSKLIEQATNGLVQIAPSEKRSGPVKNKDYEKKDE
jgi:hypothetical protein